MHARYLICVIEKEKFFFWSPNVSTYFYGLYFCSKARSNVFLQLNFARFFFVCVWLLYGWFWWCCHCLTPAQRKYSIWTYSWNYNLSLFVNSKEKKFKFIVWAILAIFGCFELFPILYEIFAMEIYLSIFFLNSEIKTFL